MNLSTSKKVSLESLAKGIPAITSEAVGFYKESCVVCFHSQNHGSGVKLVVYDGKSNNTVEVHWVGGVTARMQRAHADMVRTTEDAACAMSLLLVRELTSFTAFEQSVRGTTIDYYLSSQEQDPTLIFNRAARLESSGILQENESNTVERRVRSKTARLRPQSDIPTYIVVVEFSNPKAMMVTA